MKRLRNPWLSWMTVLLLSALSSTGAESVGPHPNLETAWRDLATLKVSDAHARFDETYKTTGSQESAYGLALCLLNLQPKTSRNIERAHELLEGLATEGATDAMKINARYFLARIDQVHRTEVDRDAAIDAYRRLLDDYPDHPAAEKAVPKLACALLLEDLSVETWEGRFGEMTGHLDRLSDPSNRLVTQLVLVEALLRIRADHARALPLLVDLLDQAPDLRADLRRDLLIQAVDSARATDRNTVAADFARRFLDDYSYDPRGGAIQAWLEDRP